MHLAKRSKKGLLLPG